MPSPSLSRSPICVPFSELERKMQKYAKIACSSRLPIWLDPRCCAKKPEGQIRFILIRIAVQFVDIHSSRQARSRLTKITGNMTKFAKELFKNWLVILSVQEEITWRLLGFGKLWKHLSRKWNSWKVPSYISRHLGLQAHSWPLKISVQFIFKQQFKLRSLNTRNWEELTSVK